jgi:acetyltransferase-like isoleucine patch superfamily enzyme
MKKKITRSQSLLNSSNETYQSRPNTLLEELRALLAEQHANVIDRFNRSLPFGDYIIDRWEKAQKLGFGGGSSVYDSALILGDVRVGCNTWIGPFTVLDGSGGLEIGESCSISAGVQIYTHDTVLWAISGGVQPPERASVRIGDRCYIGPNVIVTKGVTIGDGCVIGANSLVLEDVPPGVKALGTPCRVVGPSPSREA